MNIRRLLFLAPLVLLFLFGCQKQYVANTIIQYSMPTQKDPEKYLRGLLPPDDKSVELEIVHNTELFKIKVVGSDSAKAADRANEIALSLEKTIKAANPDAKFKIWDWARPSPKK